MPGIHQEFLHIVGDGDHPVGAPAGNLSRMSPFNIFGDILPTIPTEGHHHGQHTLHHGYGGDLPQV